MDKRYVTFEEVSGNNFRLLTPFGARDFDGGVLITDSDDQACAWLEEWASQKANIKVTVKGEVVKSGVEEDPIPDVPDPETAPRTRRRRKG